jgi:hypothetical protein
MWTLKSLIESAQSTQTCVDGQYVPARPINWQHRSLVERIREAWAVFTGHADVFVWPAGQ